ncbi:MAG: response regulator [Chitinophagaceae bacterium]
MAYRNILLIDDDKDDQEIFLSALDRLAASVAIRAVTNAREALDRLIAGDISADVIFLDLNMPVMNGQEFLAEIKKTPLQHIPVFVLSTSAHPPTIAAISRLGAYRFITKPDRFDELVSILGSVLA